jgi:hypothetical protein
LTKEFLYIRNTNEVREEDYQKCPVEGCNSKLKHRYVMNEHLKKHAIDKRSRTEILEKIYRNGQTDLVIIIEAEDISDSPPPVNPKLARKENSTAINNQPVDCHLCLEEKAKILTLKKQSFLQTIP